MILVQYTETTLKNELGMVAYALGIGEDPWG